MDDPQNLSLNQALLDPVRDRDLCQNATGFAPRHASAGARRQAVPRRLLADRIDRQFPLRSA